ncbi:hypothetical protein BH23GEM9_BH23GEM9_19820 [soil metagenome]
MTLEWHHTARGLVAANSFNPLVAGRTFAALGMAQHQAIQAANDQAGGSGKGDGVGVGGRSLYEAHRGAVAGASARVLGFLVLSAATAVDQKLAEQGSAGPGGVHPQFTRGVAIGRSVGDAMVEHLMNDGFTRPFTGTMPVGPGSPLAYGLPNYPAYPSGHQSISAAAARVLTHFFPEHAAAIEAMRAEASESRIIAGIHYRFDMDAGRTLGQGVADWVLQQAM